MKKIILTVLFLVMPTLALAQHRGRDWHYYNHNNHHHHRHGGVHWVAPLIVGGIVGAAVANANARPAPVIVQNGEAVCGHTVPCEVVIPQASPCRAVEVPVRDQSGRILEFRLVCQ